MKITILGNTNNPVTKTPNEPYSWFVKTHLDGFRRNDIDVQMIDHKSNCIEVIRDKLIRYKPSYCFEHLAFHQHHDKYRLFQMFSEINKKMGTKFIHTCSDARNEDRYSDDLSNIYHSAFVGTHGMKEKGEQDWKIPTYYCPYSSLTYDNIAEPVIKYMFKKAVFTGNPISHPDRKQFIALLKEYGVGMKIFKTQSHNDLRDKTPQLSSSANVILGLCTGYDINGYIDVRPFQYLGTGACFMGRKYHNIDNIIPDNLYYLFDGYERKDAKYVKDTWRKIMKTDTWPMRTKAFNFIQKYHSSKVRMKNVIDVLEGKENKINCFLDDI